FHRGTQSRCDISLACVLSCTHSDAHTAFLQLVCDILCHSFIMAGMLSSLRNVSHTCTLLCWLYTRMLTHYTHRPSKGVAQKRTRTLIGKYWTGALKCLCQHGQPRARRTSSASTVRTTCALATATSALCVLCLLALS